jgi:hypothetical protein
MVPATTTVVLFCGTCRVESPFEQPECLDGHAGCPEWVCVQCGEAVLLAFDAWELAEPAASETRHVA